MNETDVVIIGAGPAGIASSIQLHRYGIDAVLLEKNITGGLLLNAGHVENYPGFPEGISGKDLTLLFEKQLKRNNIHVNYEEVLSLDYHDDNFFVKTPKRKLQAKYMIVASGTVPKKSDFLQTGFNADRRIFYDLCELKAKKDEKIAIIGAGDAAFDYAISLSEENRVIILNRSRKTRCLQLLKNRAFLIDNIEYKENFTVREVESINNGLKLLCTNNGCKCTINTDYLLIATGREPSIGFMSENVKENLKFLQKTGFLYLTGDVKNGIYRQTSIAVADGIKAAMKIAEKKKGELNR
ncbi:MAG: NAD(P)/FAD-dependent oxidoreductase [Methanomicrobiaceae archaeon]|nr:NAD(P)/FAD-dependent oxidoreductase [Methanomicrobiaceae archaeon]